MFQWRLIKFVFQSVIALATVGVVYAEVAKPLINMGTGSGKFTGPFSNRIQDVDTLIPLIIAALLLFVAIFFIVANVQNEKSVKRRPPR